MEHVLLSCISGERISSGNQRAAGEEIWERTCAVASSSVHQRTYSTTIKGANNVTVRQHKEGTQASCVEFLRNTTAIKCIPPNVKQHIDFNKETHWRDLNQLMVFCCQSETTFCKTIPTETFSVLSFWLYHIVFIISWTLISCVDVQLSI